MSDAADEREDRDAWLAQSSSATLAQRRPLETSGQVGVVIEPEEYEEYSRLKNGAAKDRPESADDPIASRSPDRPAADGESDDAVQDVASFLAQLATPTQAQVDTGNDAESEDEFLAQISRAPTQPAAAASQRSGSAAFEGVATVRRAARRPFTSRLRARFPRRWRWVSLTAALLTAAGVVALLLQPTTQIASPGSPSAKSHLTTDAFAGLRATLKTIDSQVTGAARGAVSRERAEIAAERTQAARRRAARRDSAVHSRTRSRRRARSVAARSHPAAAAVTEPAATTSSPTPAPTQTVTAPATTTPATTPTTSQPTSTTKSDSTKTTTHPYGEGGVLGAGHMSGGS